MKKYIAILTAFIAIIALSSTTSIAYGQDESTAQEVMEQLTKPNVWNILTLGGDELLGTPETEIYVLTTKEQDRIAYYAYQKDKIVLFSENGVFDFERLYRGSSLYGETAIIGYYDSDGTLIEKEEAYCHKLGDSYSKGILGTKKLMDFLKNNEGSIRIVLDRYRGGNFDVTFPTWKTQSPTKIDYNI